jgi:hypothetical protein
MQPSDDVRESTKASDSQESIRVTTIGDVALDRFEWSAANRPRGDSWQNRTQVKVMMMLSGAWLLHYFLMRLGEPSDNPHRYFCYKPPQPHSKDPWVYSYHDISNLGEYSQTFTELGKYNRGFCDCDCLQPSGRKPSEKQKVYRIKTEQTEPKYYGGPQGGNNSANGEPLELCEWTNPYKNTDSFGRDGEEALCWIKEKDGKESQQPSTEDGKASRLLVIFDGEDRFRSSEEEWKPFIPEKDDRLYIVLFQKPPFPDKKNPSPLWQWIKKHHSDRTVLVISGDSLRNNGVNINKSLSWERTAQDFVTELGRTSILQELSEAKQLVVRFGLAGAIHYSRQGKNRQHSNRPCTMTPST